MLCISGFCDAVLCISARLSALVLCLSTTASVWAAPVRKEPASQQKHYKEEKTTLEVPSSQNFHVLASYYYDNRDFNTLTIQPWINSIPGGFSLWGFTDLHARDGRPSQRYEIRRSLSEYRLTWTPPSLLQVPKGIGIQYEIDAFTPGGRDIGRFGLTYQAKVDLPAIGPLFGKTVWFMLRYFPWETDGGGQQASVSYAIPLAERLSITGFADYNYGDRGNNNWVLEPQLNLALVGILSAVLEYRYNGFESDNPSLDGSGWALGLSVKL